MAAALARRFGPRRRARFLDALRRGLTVTDAARRADVGRQTAYDHRAAAPAFAAAWADAAEEGTDALEDEAFRRAVTGVERPIYHAGQVVGTARAYSDPLLMLLLRGRRPGTYGGVAIPPPARRRPPR